MTKKKKIWIVSVICAVLLMTAVGAFLMMKNRFVGNGNVLGVSWYHENGTEFIITTAEELYELAELSAHYDFKDQTILLGNDIVVNEGEMDTWLGNVWAKYWTPIDGFAGTFDGQGHTISGIYSVGYGSRTDKDGYGYKKAGLFMNTRKSCVIRDLRIENSYFYGESGGRVGSITSGGGGTFEGIYSNAVVVCDGRLGGGLIGYMDARGSHTITNCWFDGELRLQGQFSLYNGGLVGYAQNVGGTITIEHSLMTGDISCEVEDKALCLGGIVGITETNARLAIKDCLSVGTIDVRHKDHVGSIIGKHDTGAVVSMTNVYTSVECYDATIGYNKGKVVGYPLELKESKLSGFEAARWTKLDFKNYWTLVEGGTPELLYFTERDIKDTNAEKAYDISWYNESEDVYTISNAKELYGLYVLSTKNDFAGKMVKLDADIVLNAGEASTWRQDAPENYWYPIKSFAGVFDGQGHTISGAYVKTSQRNAGFFAATTEEALVKNLRLENSYFENTCDNQAWLGSIVGLAKGRFQTLYSNAIVVSSGSICGGIIGGASDSGTVRIADCWFDGSVEQTQYYASGGILACAEGGGDIRVEHCLNSGSITGVTTVAGICGLVSGKTSVSITDSLNTGKITSTKNSIFASIITQKDNNSSLRLSDCFGAVEDCQHIIWQTHGTLEGNGITLEKEQLTGYKGYQWTTLNFEKYWSVVKDSTPILQSFTKEVPSLAGVKRKFDISWYDEDKNSYTLNSAEDLYGFYMISNITDFKGKTVKLGKDITINTGNASDWKNKVPKDVWYPISTFAGTFDGQGHSISGLYLKTDKRGVGMFSQTEEGSILKNFRLVNSYFENTGDKLGQFGSVVGILKGNLSNIYSDAMIVSSASVCGGIVGSVSSTGKVKISNCWFAGEVTQTEHYGVGGIIGVVEGGCNATVSHCLNTGKITGLTTVSGICGLVVHDKTTVTIRDTLNAGKVTSTKNSVFAGIITQRAENTTVNIEETYSTLESCVHSVWATHGSMKGSCIQLSEEQLKGYGGYQWTFLDFANYWAVVADTTPVLKTFAQGELSLTGIGKKVDVSWYDANQSTYILDSMQDLYGFYMISSITDFKDKTLKLGADIVVNTGNSSEWKTSTPENQWYPIGTFAGVFDGQGHSISGLYLKTDERGVGMFSQITEGSVLKNFRLVNSYFENTGEKLGQFGSVVGIAKGNLSNIYSDALVVSSASVCGGLVGSMSGTGKVEISNCWFAGEITQTANYGVGGLIGIVEGGCNATVSHCLNTGTVTGLTAVSGICGMIFNDKTAITIQDTFNAGKVTSTMNSVFAAIITQRAENTTVKIEETYSTLESCVHSVWATHGSMKGSCIQLSEEQLKGYGGYQWTSLDFAHYWAAVTDTTPVLKSFARGELSLAGIDKKVDVSWYDANESTYILDSIEDLYGFYMLSNITDFKGKTVQLGTDIEINKGIATENGWTLEVAGEEPQLWYPINNFAGTFDGQGYSISGLYLKTDVKGVGMFAQTTKGSVLKNFRLMNSYFESAVDGQAWIGSIAGNAAGTFETIYSDAIVISKGAVTGGLLGGEEESANLKIADCWFNGKVVSSGAYSTGGIIGFTKNGDTQMQKCLNTGSVQGTAQVAGICGTIDGDTTLTITESLNAGKVTGTSKAAALVVQVGKNTTVNISNTYYTSESLGWSVFHSAGITNDSSAKYSESNLKGVLAQDVMTVNFKNDWVMQYDALPILHSFIDFAKQSDVDISWYDANETTMKIGSLEALKGFNYIANVCEKTFAGKTVQLTSDITVNKGIAKETGWEPEAAGEEPTLWVPINNFKGTFDGQGHSISGIYCTKDSKWSGFFQATMGNAVVKDFRLLNSYFESTYTDGQAWIGSIAGHAEGTFETIYSDAIVVSKAPVTGGLLGGDNVSTDVKITDCWFDGKVHSTGAYATGGIIGLVQAGGKTEIQQCLSTGSVYGSAQVAGICGLVANDGTQLVINDSLNSGKITGGNPKAALVVTAYANSNVTITNTYCTTESSQHPVWRMNNTTGTLDNQAKQYAESQFKGFVDQNTIKLDFTNDWAMQYDSAPILRSFIDLSKQSDADISWYIPTATTMQIDSLADLKGFNYVANTGKRDFAGQTIQLTKDIVVNEGKAEATGWTQTTGEKYSWTPITGFAGTFDGQGHSISGICSEQTTKYNGFFGTTTDTAIVKDFRLMNSYFSSTANPSWMGSIAGKTAGTFETIYSDAIVVGNVSIKGGLFAGEDVSSDVQISNCWFAGIVTQNSTYTYATGGIIGLVQNGETKIQNCLNTGIIQGSQNVSGICGMASNNTTVTIKDCLIAGKITGSSRPSAIISSQDGATPTVNITNTYCTTESYKWPVFGIETTGYKQCAEENLKGVAALNNTTLDFTNDWVVQDNSVPILQSFIDLRKTK